MMLELHSKDAFWSYIYIYILWLTAIHSRIRSSCAAPWCSSFQFTVGRLIHMVLYTGTLMLVTPNTATLVDNLTSQWSECESQSQNSSFHTRRKCFKVSILSNTLAIMAANLITASWFFLINNWGPWRQLSQNINARPHGTTVEDKAIILAQRIYWQVLHHTTY